MYHTFVGETYRIIRLVALIQRARDVINFRNHLAQVLAHLIQPIRHILGQFVGALTLLIRAAQLLATANLLLEQSVDLTLILIEISLELVLLALNRLQLSVDLVGGFLSFMCADEELLDLLAILNQETIPFGDLFGLAFELLLVFLQI